MPPQNVQFGGGMRDTLPSSSSLVDEDGSPRYPPSDPSGATIPRNTSISHLSQEQAKVKVIRDAIRAEDKRLRSKYFFLREEWQDAMGLLVYLSAALAWLAVSVAWYTGRLPASWTIVLNALAISFLHEMEHDLIHDLYFKRQKWVQNAMFAFIWVIKSNANPWWRRYYHLRHHQYAGQVVDVEERLIGLGMKWYDPRRILVTLTPVGTLLIADSIARDDPEFSKKVLVRYNAPVIAISTAAMVIHGLLHLGLADWLAPLLPAAFVAVAKPWVESQLVPALLAYNVAVNFPNVLRQSCLVLISTYSHYYGDIPERDVFFQTQILDHPILYPFQLFCFNFGATHIIHHFVTRQPFYLRQLTAFKLLPIMKELGCRHNDLGNHFRANRWGWASEKKQM